MLGIAASGKGVRRFFRNDIQLRYRQIGLRRQAFHYGVEARELLSVYRLRAAGFQGDLVREEIRYGVHYDCERQRDLHAGGTRESVSRDHQEHAQQNQQNARPENFHELTAIPSALQIPRKKSLLKVRTRRAGRRPLKMTVE